MEKRRVGVRAIIVKDGKLLAVKHKTKAGRVKDFWVIPGGGLDPGEALEEGLRREMIEELGVDVKVGRLLFVQQFHSSRSDRDEELEFFFMIDNPEDFSAFDFTTTSHGAEELEECTFIDPKSEAVLPGFINEIDLQVYVNTLMPVLIANRFSEG